MASFVGPEISWPKLKSTISGVKDDMTVVVLGETGVGKSTWINSFCNYLLLTSFEDALLVTKKFYVPVYTKFAYPLRKNIQNSGINENDESDDDDEFQDVLIEYGCRNNTETIEEKFASTVKSCTKAPFSYEITHGNGSITLVDTQGVADNTYTGEDTKEEDNKSINQTLEHISTFGKIDAFVILLKPGMKRLNDGFRYCMKRLFSELHTSALQNVVFAFTHAKNTDFLPGESVRCLKELFKEIKIDFKITSKNLFFFDNTPFRYLAVHGKGHKPNESELNMREYWEKSTEQCTKMLEYVRKLKPHDTGNMYSVHASRMTIQLMTEPLVEICKDIKEAQAKLFAEREKVENDIKDEGKETVYVPAEENNDKTERKQHVYAANRMTMKYKALNTPQTVCTNPECCEEKTVEQADGTRVRKIVYKPICCEDCKLPFVALDSKGSWILKFCSVFPMFSNNCKVCQHPMKEHAHIKYCLEHINEDIQLTLEEMQKRCEQLTSEYNFIVDAMGKFIFYQRKNSITTFHDSITNHLDDDIDRINIRRGDSGALEDTEEETLKVLVELKSSYVEKYNELMNNSTSALQTPKDVIELLENIFLLEIKGEQLKQIYEKIKAAHKIYGHQNNHMSKKFNLKTKDGGFPKVKLR